MFIVYFCIELNYFIKVILVMFNLISINNVYYLSKVIEIELIDLFGLIF